MIGVIVPAHNEALLIEPCLRSIAASTRCVDEDVRVYVALDSCTDATALLARRCGAALVDAPFRNVGRARGAAARAALADGARWLASTDADSQVPPDWLAGQLLSAGDAFCGIVRVEDWAAYPSWMARLFHDAGEPMDGHTRVHGANLGVSAPWYRRVGGFPPVPAHEDVGLIRALTYAGARIVALAQPAVITSARRDSRAPRGFGHYLLQMEHMALATGASD